MTTRNATTSIDLDTLKTLLEKVEIIMKNEKDPVRLGRFYTVRYNLVWARDSVEFAGEKDAHACTLYDKAISQLRDLGVQ